MEKEKDYASFVGHGYQVMKSILIFSHKQNILKNKYDNRKLIPNWGKIRTKRIVFTMIFNV